MRRLEAGRSWKRIASGAHLYRKEALLCCGGGKGGTVQSLKSLGVKGKVA